MYRVLKVRGNRANVVVENIDTKANVIIGKITIEILKILAEAGYKTEDGTLNISDEWNLSIEKEIATKLTATTMKMKKPIRDQSKKINPDIRKEVNKKVDAMDVLLGLASYS